jgi:hypothetical protein
MEWSTMWELMRQARWDGFWLAFDAVIAAANERPWIWAVVVLAVLTAGRRTLFRLTRFIGIGIVRHSDG